MPSKKPSAKSRLSALKVRAVGGRSSSAKRRLTKKPKTSESTASVSPPALELPVLQERLLGNFHGPAFWVEFNTDAGGGGSHGQVTDCVISEGVMTFRATERGYAYQVSMKRLPEVLNGFSGQIFDHDELLGSCRGRLLKDAVPDGYLFIGRWNQGEHDNWFAIELMPGTHAVVERTPR